MSKHDPEITFRQMLEYSEEVLSLVKGKTQTDIEEGRLLNLALMRLLEMIGEAANRIPDPVQDEYPEFPWLQVIGLRNRLIHGYDSIDYDILWTILTADLPSIVQQLHSITDQWI